MAVGNQSAGKSSVLESISGIQFPRDSGTCTRCPTRLQLRSIKEEDENQEERAEIWTEFDEPKVIKIEDID